MLIDCEIMEGKFNIPSRKTLANFGILYYYYMAEHKTMTKPETL